MGIWGGATRSRSQQFLDQQRRRIQDGLREKWRRDMGGRLVDEFEGPAYHVILMEEMPAPLS